MKCSDPNCDKAATRELLGLAMCEAYYVEALEHSAHIVCRNVPLDRYVGLTSKGLPVLGQFITFDQWLAQPEATSP